ncbi:DUF928 domain-containing protein [Spirulina sp. 06S082]|uniref:DUF928 domain-containing protein n=1 Tax=Spirulina sp. 06S082 TaxID=3110248 RepID=UPI002B1FB609|nr:DUF928 domain-containing protein [Spirulina sp. 06S082]MEA5467526.1 DUF928 domain-containing protein [Spirulina sp. 06S082]
MNHLKLRTLFALYLSLQVLSLATPPRVGAEEHTHLNPIEAQLVFNEAFEPTEGERPNTRGGGARPGLLKCQGDREVIETLVPKQRYGLTFEERPSIFVNLPETTAREVWLSFKDENGDFFETAILPIAQKSGIVRFSWPDRLPPLETGNTYKWTLAVVCGENLDPDDPLFTGYVTRIDRTANIEQELAQKTAIEQAKWYADRGYWYDLLLTIVRARQEQPDNPNLKTLWESLLSSVGLENIASQPLGAIE